MAGQGAEEGLRISVHVIQALLSTYAGLRTAREDTVATRLDSSSHNSQYAHSQPGSWADEQNCAWNII